jgi:hypothetical protein
MLVQQQCGRVRALRGGHAAPRAERRAPHRNQQPRQLVDQIALELRRLRAPVLTGVIIDGR